MIEFIKHHVALRWTIQIGESYNRIYIIHAAVVMMYASCTSGRCNADCACNVWIRWKTRMYLHETLGEERRVEQTARAS